MFFCGRLMRCEQLTEAPFVSREGGNVIGAVKAGEAYGSFQS